MANIIKCFGEYCDRKEQCYRYKAKSSKIQSYSDFEMDCELHGYRNQLFMDKGRKAEGITLISVLTDYDETYDIRNVDKSEKKSEKSPIHNECTCNREFNECSVKKQTYNKAIDDYKSELKAYLRRFSIKSVGDEDFDYIAEQLKGGNQ